MGYTGFTKEKIEHVIHGYSPKNVLDFGSQNDYERPSEKPPYVSDWYATKGIKYSSIDLAGDNGALKLDVSYPVNFSEKFDLVVDAGFSEHVVQMEAYETTSFHDGHINSIYPTKVTSIERGYYNCWLNKFNSTRDGGIIFSENPKQANWPLHAYTWVDFNTYWQLSRVSGLYIVEIGEHPASGNTTDGYNIWCIMKKVDNLFPTFEQFKEKVQVYSK